ncbi:hypothetical protein D9M68_787430 [compost metagenome]
MHGQIGLAGAHAVVGLDRNDQAAAAAAHLYQIAGLQALAAQFVRVQAEYGLGSMAEQTGGGAGAAHAVPLVAQAAGVEGQGKAGVALFPGRPIGVGLELRAAVSGRKMTVAVKAWSSVARANRKRPLLGTLVVQNRVAEPREVEVAISGQVFVFLEQRLRTVEGKQAGQAGAEQFL